MFTPDNKQPKKALALSEDATDAMIDELKAKIQRNFSKSYKVNDLFLLNDVISYIKISIDLLKLEIEKQKSSLRDLPIIWPWLNNKNDLSQKKEAYKEKINALKAKIRNRQQELMLLRFAQEKLSQGVSTFHQVIAFTADKEKQLEARYSKGGRTPHGQNILMAERNLLATTCNRLIDAHNIFVQFHKEPKAYLIPA